LGKQVCICALTSVKPISHTINFAIPLPQSTATKLSFSDKAFVRTLTLELREQKMSYQEIGSALGLPWTQVWQIISTHKPHK
jgi:hypothetical protein